MTDELTTLIEEVVRQWNGQLPRLSYISDAGGSEVKFFRRVLRKMRHPVSDRQDARLAMDCRFLPRQRTVAYDGRSVVWRGARSICLGAPNG